MRLTRKQIEQKVRFLIEEWNKEGWSPESINNGCCGEFADALWNACKRRGQTHWGDDPKMKRFFGNENHGQAYGHSFFSYGPWFFDSEFDRILT